MNNPFTTNEAKLKRQATEAGNAFREALAEQPAQQQEPVATFDEVWNAIDWDKWRMEPIRELVRMIHSKTSPQPSNTSTPAKCWKCGDADPAFTDVCQVPACGTREQP